MGVRGEMESPVNEVRELGVDEFNSRVRGSEKSHLVFFYSPVCPYCAQFGPVFESVGRELNPSDPHLWRLDCKANGRFCLDLGLKKVPTLLFFKGGKVYRFDSEKTPKNLALFIARSYKTTHPIVLGESEPTYLQLLTESGSDLVTLFSQIFSSQNTPLQIAVATFLLVLSSTAGLSLLLYLKKMLRKPPTPTPTPKPKND